MKTLFQILIFMAVLAAGLLVFRRVRLDYQRNGKLSRFSSLLEIFIFFLHGSASYAFLDSEISHIDNSTPLFYCAVVLMAVGFVFVIVAMARLGWSTSVGQSVCRLRQNGLYRYSRNPQIVAYFLFISGYALLWPSISGVAWVALYCAIARIMVRTEEDHMRRAYGKEVEEYYQVTPRYIGLTKE